MTLRDGLDLEPTFADWTVSMSNKDAYRPAYADNLRAALEAALAVIEALTSYEKPMAKIEKREASEAIFSAQRGLAESLKPFRKEGLG